MRKTYIKESKVKFLSVGDNTINDLVVVQTEMVGAETMLVEYLDLDNDKDCEGDA